MSDSYDVRRTVTTNPDGSTVEEVTPRPYVPHGFSVKESGVYGLDEDGAQDTAICSPLHIEALTSDGTGHAWGKLLVWKDPDGRLHEWAMPNSMLATDGAEYRRHLLDNGLGIRAGKKAQNGLHDYIMTANPPARAISAIIPGWHGRRYIAVDGGVYGTGEGRVLLQAAGMLPKMERRGTLESWREKVARYAEGNSRLVLAICAAFAGPLLYFANEGSGGFHFTGESSGGKTTALRLGASVWGCPLRSWRTTDNAAESWARFANDGFLAIDELGQVDGKAADQMAYMLGNGQTKGRANRDGIARDTSEFRLMFLSTGEIGLAEKMGEGKKKAKAGQAVRMIEVPADAGKGMRLFEDLHGQASADEMAKYLRQAVEENQGHAAPAWLEKLAGMDADKLRAAIASMTKVWMDSHVPKGSDGQVLRASRRFALAAAAGELAAAAGLLPWNDQAAADGIAQCFKDWLGARGGIGSMEVRNGLTDIENFIMQHGNDRFQTISDESKNLERVINRAGFKRAAGAGEYEYLMARGMLQSEVLGGSRNMDGIIRAAVTQGLIIPGNDGRTAKLVNLPGIGKRRMLCIVPGSKKDEDTE